MARHDRVRRRRKYPAPGFTYPDGKPASLFSSANAKTVERHFEWMRKYGIDGVLRKRFLVGLGRGAADSDRILGEVRNGHPDGPRLRRLL